MKTVFASRVSLEVFVALRFDGEEVTTPLLHFQMMPSTV